ncbi:MAG: AsmA family protein, partial [Elusimicrobiaceae bacterium]|nr:AsmA family protein [Elusimicrobiaceae bacterium]
MIKKLIKLMCICAVVVAVLAGVGIFTLYKMYPPAKLKAMAQQYVAKNYQREVRFDDISLTWIGFTLTNVALSENTTFADGDFIKADKLTARVAVKPLLQKRIVIDTIETDGLDVQIIQQKDGSFNFDTLFSSDDTTVQDSTQDDSEPTHIPFMVTAEKFAFNDCDILYIDQQTGMRLALNELNINLYHFDLDNPFEAEISFMTDISGTG